MNNFQLTIYLSLQHKLLDYFLLIMDYNDYNYNNQLLIQLLIVHIIKLKLKV